MATPEARAPARALRRLFVWAPAALLAVAAYTRRWMSDDGFINLRVAEHIAAGLGPNYNTGERVEAATSVIWVWLLAACRALPGETEHSAVALGLLCTVAGLVLLQRSYAGVVSLPLAAWLVVPLPVVWDFTTSGLETGLVLLWMAGCVAGLRRRSSFAPVAFLIGLGPLVRPDLGVFSVAWLGVLWLQQRASLQRQAADSPVPWRLRAPSILVAAGSVPIAYQLFRMGYFASLVPNTALAKSASSSRWDQGLLYLLNFVDPYLLCLPLVGVGLLLSMDRDRGAEGEAALRGATVVAALTFGLYITRLGGGFMHGRLLLPAWFGLCAVAPAMPALREWRARPLPVAVGLSLLAWAVCCAATLRPPERAHGIVDERRLHLQGSRVPNPVTLADYENHQWMRAWESVWSDPSCGLTLESRMRPGRAYALRGDADVDACRIVVLHSIGMLGYRAGIGTHIVDRAGLTEPLGARLRIHARGRPGHEKYLLNDWVVARFAPARERWSQHTEAARQALGCGALDELRRAIREPLTPDRVLRNIAQSVSLTRLQLPSDPQEAVLELCP